MSSQKTSVKASKWLIFKFGEMNEQNKQYIGIALIIIGLLGFIFVMSLPHSHYNPQDKASSSKPVASSSKSSKKVVEEEKKSAPPTPKSSRKKAAPKAVADSPVETAKPRTRGNKLNSLLFILYNFNFQFIIK
jgi:hypothetical protein